MYNFVLGKTYASWTAAATTSGTEGQVNLSYIKNDGTRAAVDANVHNAFDLQLRRLDANGGNVMLPLSKRALSVAKLQYSAATTFVATVTFVNVVAPAEATLVISKKGVPFNERATWTANFPITADMTGAQIAQKMASLVNANTQSHGLVATYSNAVVTLTAQTAGVDYTIQATDDTFAATVSVTTAGVEGIGTVEQIKTLANKAANDAGFEYTYKDGADLIYPQYPFDPAVAPATVPAGYTVVAIRCGEPRDYKTHEETVHQTVFVVFPTTADAQADSLISALVTVGASVISKKAAANSGGGA